MLSFINNQTKRNQSGRNKVIIRIPPCRHYHSRINYFLKSCLFAPLNPLLRAARKTFPNYIQPTRTAKRNFPKHNGKDTEINAWSFYLIILREPLLLFIAMSNVRDKTVLNSTDTKHTQSKFISSPKTCSGLG